MTDRSRDLYAAAMRLIAEARTNDRQVRRAVDQVIERLTVMLDAGRVSRSELQAIITTLCAAVELPSVSSVYGGRYPAARPRRRQVERRLRQLPRTYGGHYSATPDQLVVDQGLRLVQAIHKHLLDEGREVGVARDTRHARQILGMAMAKARKLRERHVGRFRLVDCDKPWSTCIGKWGYDDRKVWYLELPLEP